MLSRAPHDFDGDLRVHQGRIDVTGTAPDGLQIRQGLRPDGTAHLEFLHGVLVPPPEGAGNSRGGCH